jgi:hypothetical protein
MPEETTQTEELSVTQELELSVFKERFENMKFTDDPAISMLHFMLQMMLEMDGTKPDTCKKVSTLCQHSYRAGVIAGVQFVTKYLK